MMKHEFYYTSRDSVTKIHAIEWLPDRDIKGVLQICHGMVEYIDRYDEFAEFMSEHGYYVVGHDHLGHGKSIQTEADLGYFDERKGNQYVIGDIYQLQEMTRKKYPDVPYFMLGHSMGSFLLRQYLTMYAGGLAGVIIMGTGHQGMLTLCAGRMICRVIAAFKGWKYRSAFVDRVLEVSIRNLNLVRHRRNGSHPIRKNEMNMCGIRCVPIHLHWEPIIRCLPV